MLRFVTVCTISYLLLGRVDLRAQRAIVIKLSRGRPVALCVGLSSALWKNGGSDLDAVWHHRSDGSGMRQVVAFVDRSTRRGTFGGEFGAPLCNRWGLYGVRVIKLSIFTMERSISQRRGPLPKLLWADLLWLSSSLSSSVKFWLIIWCCCVWWNIVS